MLDIRFIRENPERVQAAIGMWQCLSLIPGISRSGATISVGLFCGFDRVSVTKLSSFLGIPALLLKFIQGTGVTTAV